MWKRNSSVNKCIAVLLLLGILTAACSGCMSGGVPVSDGVTFTDDLGRKVCAPHKPKRVAALLGSFADVWLLSGGTLCAAAADAWEDFDLDLPGAVNVGGAHSPSLEILFSAEPDLILASAASASHVALREVLETAGIPVAYFDVISFSDYLAMLDICTDITGRKDLYKENGTDIEARIEEIKAAYASAEIPAARRTVLLLRLSSGSVKVKGSEGTVLGEMLRDLGCINIADGDGHLLETLSVESVILHDPYHIFTVTMGDDTESALSNLSRMMEENPAWGNLSAVREGRLHLMERNLFNLKPNGKWAEAYEKLTEILTEE